MPVASSSTQAQHKLDYPNTLLSECTFSPPKRKTCYLPTHLPIYPIHRRSPLSLARSFFLQFYTIPDGSKSRELRPAADWKRARLEGHLRGAGSRASTQTPAPLLAVGHLDWTTMAPRKTELALIQLKLALTHSLSLSPSFSLLLTDCPSHRLLASLIGLDGYSAETIASLQREGLKTCVGVQRSV